MRILSRVVWLAVAVQACGTPSQTDAGSGGGSAGGAAGGAAGGTAGGSAGGSAGGAAGGTAGGSAGGAAGGTAGGSSGFTCSATNPLDAGCTGFSPFDTFDGGTYQGLPVFEYANGVMPAAHRTEGIARANQIVPLGLDGGASATGAYLLISIGYSNTTQEFCKQNGLWGPPSACDPWTFMGQANADPRVRKQGLVIFNGAAGSQTNLTWDQPTDMNYARVAANLSDAGYSEAQVQVGWLKIANPQPMISLPNPNADAYQLEASTASVVRAMKARYPNLKMVFISSRTYGGWANTTLNPEPYAYEGAFAVSWVVADQIRQMAGMGTSPDAGNLDYASVAPWIAWGPYLWTDGLRGRASDGMVWTRADTENDGTHPSMTAEQKVGGLLKDFFLGSPFTRCWFSTDGGSCQ